MDIISSELTYTLERPNLKTKNKLESNNDFNKHLVEKSFETNLENYLNLLSSDIEKQSHIKTLETLEEQGFTIEQLNKININLLNLEKSKSNLNLSQNEKEDLDRYQSLFKKVQEVIQEAHEKKLQLKKLQVQTFLTDTVLKTKDMLEGIKPKEYILNIKT